VRGQYSGLAAGRACAQLVPQGRVARQNVQGVSVEHQARRAREQGRPGEALDLARVVATRWPMDNEILDQAAQLAGEVFSQQGETLRGLQRDLDEAAFFSTRGGLFIANPQGLNQQLVANVEGESLRWEP
jgi:hypothetical protein